MEWLPFALFAYVIWSSCNLLSKVLISRHVSSITVNLIGFGVWNLSPLLLLPMRGIHFPRFDLLLIAIGSGVLYFYILIPYLKALAIEEASRVVPLWRFTPLFLLLFFGNFSGERLDIWQISAFILLVIGGFLVSVKQISDLFKPTKAFYLMIFASFLSAAYSSIAKYIYLHLDFYDGFTLMRGSVGICSVLMLCLPTQRQEVQQTLRGMSRKVCGLMLLNGLLEFSGLVFYNFAMSLAPVSLVSASAGIQAIFVLLLSIFFSFKFPQFIHEDMSQSVLTQKGVAIALIVVGTGIISLH
ncbi:MAG TPA: EamA family transporter [Trichocoleus sp.]|jgi:drug/metabolite transporter (DMT)-like permease